MPTVLSTKRNVKVHKIFSFFQLELIVSQEDIPCIHVEVFTLPTSKPAVTTWYLLLIIRLCHFLFLSSYHSTEERCLGDRSLGEGMSPFHQLPFNLTIADSAIFGAVFNFAKALTLCMYAHPLTAGGQREASSLHSQWHCFITVVGTVSPDDKIQQKWIDYYIWPSFYK